MIDTKPAVGRILLRDTIFHHTFVRKGGVISRISGSRIYFILQGKMDDGDREEYVSKFSAICDTPEEESLLLNMSESNQTQIYKLEQKNRENFYALFDKDLK